MNLVQIEEDPDAYVPNIEKQHRRKEEMRKMEKWYEEHLATLRAALDEAGLASVGEPTWARYDPPWTPWFRRRNEVLIALDDASPDPSPE